MIIDAYIPTYNTYIQYIHTFLNEPMSREFQVSAASFQLLDDLPAHIYVCMYVYVCMVCMYECMYVCMYVCMRRTCMVTSQLWKTANIRSKALRRSGIWYYWTLDMYVCMYNMIMIVWVYVCMYVCMIMIVWVGVCMYVWSNMYHLSAEPILSECGSE